jgi:DNA-3-methyladenine glycosylase II
VLAQRLRIAQAARLRAELIARHGADGAFPPPHTLARLDLDLPGRKGEYLRAVAEAALDGLLDGAALRAVDPGQAVQRVQARWRCPPCGAAWCRPTRSGSL